LDDLLVEPIDLHAKRLQRLRGRIHRQENQTLFEPKFVSRLAIE
jgi:hypothetical protein